MYFYRVMPISQSLQVFNLVKSLTKAEKRNFRQYAKRIQHSDELLFLQLFDLLDKQKTYDEERIVSSMGRLGKNQYSNIKRHLYSQVITSLRLLHKEKRANFKVREYLDFAYILYGKGLHLQALKLLRKAKVLAQKHHLVYMNLTILELEKTIETRHITRSGSQKAENLIEESAAAQQDANHLVRLSNLRLRVYAKYIQHGNVKNKEEAEAIKAYYREQIDNIDTKKLGFMESVYYLQSRVWYNYILLDFKSCLKHAKKWIALLDKNPAMIERDVDLYIRGFHYVLTTAYHLNDIDTHRHYLEVLESFRKSHYLKFNHNSQIRSFLYVHSARLDHITLNGTFSNAETVIAKSLNRIRRYNYKLDDHRIMVFYYKFAWLYLGAGKVNKSIDYLNRIINNELNKLRVDLQNYSRVLQLICHYELGNFDILQYLLNTHSNYFNRQQSLNTFLKLAMNMFHELRMKGISDHKSVFEQYLNEFKKIGRTRYKRRALVYLDIISWLESKIAGISLEQVIQNKAKNFAH